MNPTGNDHDFRHQLGKFRLDPLANVTSTSTPTPTANVNALPAYPPPPTPSAHPDFPATPLPPAHSSAVLSRSKRVSTACDFCRQRKKKCDFRYPNCSACTRANRRCTIAPPGPQVANSPVARDELENLQKRVKWLEDVLRRRTGVPVDEVATGAAVDGEGDPDWWYQVPSLLANSAHRPPSSSTPDTNTPNAPSDGQGFGTDLPNVGEIFRDQLEHRRPSIARPAAPTPRVLRLSSLQETERVANAYFDSIGYQYPFLHRSEFMSYLQRIWSGWTPPPEVHNSYHITMAIALFMEPPKGFQPVDFYRVSQETFQTTLQNEDLTALRALLSLALYTMFATTGPSIWHVLGSAMRLATSMGLHKARPAASLGEEELSKRAFWSLYNLDRLIAVTLGRPLGISDDDITVALPREFNDDWTETPGTSSMTIPLQVMRLRQIFSGIYRYRRSLATFAMTVLIRQCTTTDLHRRRKKPPVS